MPFYKAPPPAAAPMAAQVYAVCQGLGSRGSLKGDDNAAQTNHSLGGVISGLDVTFNGSWRFGVAGGYSQSSFNSPSNAASGSSDSYHISLYGGGRTGAWGLRGGASFSWSDIITSRQIAVVNLAGLQRGAQVFGEVGHQVRSRRAGAFRQLAYVNVEGVNETGVASLWPARRLHAMGWAPKPARPGCRSQRLARWFPGAPSSLTKAISTPSKAILSGCSEFTLRSWALTPGNATALTCVSPSGQVKRVRVPWPELP
jgi:hypothetical protein